MTPSEVREMTPSEVASVLGLDQQEAVHVVPFDESKPYVPIKPNAPVVRRIRRVV